MRKAPVEAKSGKSHVLSVAFDCDWLELYGFFYNPECFQSPTPITEFILFLLPLPYTSIYLLHSPNDDLLFQPLFWSRL
jgi:hypothetical protein